MTERTRRPGWYWYEDVQDGDDHTVGSLADSHTVSFAGLSDGFFDLHMDDDFALARGFPARVAHCILGLAFADGLKNRWSVRIMSNAPLRRNWAFRGAPFASDRITVNVSGAQKRRTGKSDRGIATPRFMVIKQDGSMAQESEKVLLTRWRPYTLEAETNG